MELDDDYQAGPGELALKKRSSAISSTDMRRNVVVLNLRLHPQRRLNTVQTASSGQINFCVPCNFTIDCSNNAISCTGNSDAPNCTCQPEWTGSTCAVSNMCTNAVDCSGQATSVSGNRPSCTCTCAPEWTGASCQTSNVCTNDPDCNNHATSVSGNRPSCTCSCPPEWIGSACETSNVCDNGADCSSHATSVTGSRPSCSCTCSLEWIGTKCEISNVCTDAVDCNNRAGRVVGNRPTCTCYCLAAYHGKTCNVTRTVTWSTTKAISSTRTVDVTNTFTTQMSKTHHSATLSKSVTVARTRTHSIALSNSMSFASVRPSQTLSDTLSLALISTTSTLRLSFTATTSLSVASRTPSHTSTPSLTNTQSTASLASGSLSRPTRTRSKRSETLTKSRTHHTNNNMGITLSISLTTTAWHNSSSVSDSISDSFSQSLTKDSPTVSSSATCTPDIYISTRTAAESLGNEASYCNTAWNLQNNNPNDDSSATSRTGGPPSCFVGYAAASQSNLLQNLVFSRVLQSTIQLPVYLVLPFALNATDWVVEKYAGAAATIATDEDANSTKGVDAAAAVLSSSASSNNSTTLSTNDDNSTTITTHNSSLFVDPHSRISNASGPSSATTGVVVFELNHIPEYDSVYHVTVGYYCGGRYETTVLTGQWPSKPVVISVAQEVFTGLMIPLGFLTGDARAAASLALLSSLSCTGEPLTSSTTGAYFISVFFDFGYAALALGNLGIVAVFCLIQMTAAIFVSSTSTKRKCTDNTATNGGKHAAVTANFSELKCDTSPSITATHHHPHHPSLRHTSSPGDTSSVASSSSSSSAHPQHGPPCWMLAAAAVRGPAWSILALQFLIPGTVYGAVLCLSSAEDSELGGVALLLGMASLAALLAALVFIIRPTAVYVTYPTTVSGQQISSSLERRLGLLPTAHWAPLELVKSFSPLLTSLRVSDHCPSLTLADIALTCLLASASALGVGTKGASCSYAPPTVAAAYFLFAIVLCALQPQRLPTDRLLSPIVSVLVGITCIMKNLEEDTVVVETLLSVTQLFQMGIRLWVMFREWQWQRSAATTTTTASSSSIFKDSGSVDNDDPFSLELSTLPNSNNTTKSPTAHSGSEKDDEDSFVWTAGGAGNLMVMY
ncbi:transmembrane protein, putative [Bodo saltans]|uniref:Transmembrane protein, putative n=1 Tax=Bodo saltans TaxID=75058 RepID=A0A0S4JRF6_BODSA|nr:transmembrane protein, putative [Bodo saltans]|eukprot:CUG92785.1 transmembrane protein, putative [Bodo saltans]